MLSFPGVRQSRVSFTVQDSTISGKKEICSQLGCMSHVVRNGLLIYSHTVSNHPKETLYSKRVDTKNTVDDATYNLTLDYYSYYLQHVIHIQVLQ